MTHQFRGFSSLIVLLIVVVLVGIGISYVTKKGPVDRNTLETTRLLVDINSFQEKLVSGDSASKTNSLPDTESSGWLVNENEAAGIRFKSPNDWNLSSVASYDMLGGKTVKTVRAEAQTLDPSTVYLFSTTLSLEEAKVMRISWDDSAAEADKVEFEELTIRGRSVVQKRSYFIDGFNIGIKVVHLFEQNGTVYGAQTDLHPTWKENDDQLLMRMVVSLEPLRP